MSDQTAVNGVVLAPHAPKKNQYPLLLILTDVAGTPIPQFKPAAAQADSTAADVATMKTDFNALLAKLRTAGIIASS